MEEFLLDKTKLLLYNTPVTSYRQFETILSLNKTTGDVLATASI